MMLRRAVQESPGCDGVVLGGHGLFTWGNTQRECYDNTITIIDQLGQFVVEPRRARKARSCSAAPRYEALWITDTMLALEIFPFLRGRVSGSQRVIGNFTDLPEVLHFVNSADAARLAHLGTSCPDHFIRTKVRPLFVPWAAGSDECASDCAMQIDSALEKYRKRVRGILQTHSHSRTRLRCEMPIRRSC